jgi:hypothetical protein
VHSEIGGCVERIETHQGSCRAMVRLAALDTPYKNS